MRRRNETVVWTAGAAGVVLGGMLGVVAGGVICAATIECGLEGGGPGIRHRAADRDHRFLVPFNPCGSCRP